MHFPLHPETPAQGRSLEDLFKGKDIGPIRERFKTLFKEAGLPYGERSMTYNSRLAQELGAWADTQDGGDAIHDKLYRAYFVDGVNISDIDVLVEIAESIGLDSIRARGVLEQGEFKAVVDADWQRSREYGITGVPTYHGAQTLMVGCQPYEMVEKFYLHCVEKLTTE